MKHKTTFGCSALELESAWNEMIGYKELHIMGMMSDAQYEMEIGMNERAVKTLNRAKYFMSKLLEERMARELS